VSGSGSIEAPGGARDLGGRDGVVARLGFLCLEEKEGSLLVEGCLEWFAIASDGGEGLALAGPRVAAMRRRQS
jgi:hypothetical protein